MPHVHIVKLSVGTESVADLAAWQQMRIAQAPDGLPRHVTRMWPKREAEILDGGSIYWVIKGVIQARQKILRLDEVIGEDGVRRCAIVLDPELIETRPAPRRPFQGWRYLKPEEAPGDLDARAREEADLPAELRAVLNDIGVL